MARDSGPYPDRAAHLALTALSAGLATGLLGLAALVALPSEAAASHLAGWSSSWRRTGETEVRFRMQSWWRASDGQVAADPFTGGAHCRYGPGCDGMTGGTEVSGQTWDAQNATLVLDRLLAEGEALHDYSGLASPGDDFATYLYTCCAVSVWLEGNRDERLRATSHVQLAQAPAMGALPYGSPQLAAPAQFTCQRNVPCEFQLPALALEGRPLRFDWAPTGSAGSFLQVQIPGSVYGSPMSLDPATGVVSWQAPPQVGLYGAAVRVTYDDDPSTAAVSATDMIFEIHVRSGPLSDLPAFTAASPADGSVIEVPLGQTVDLAVGGTDPQGDPVSIQAAGAAASYDQGTGLLTVGGFTDEADLGPHLVVVSLSDEPAAVADAGVVHREYVVVVTPAEPLVDVAAQVEHVSGPDPPEVGTTSVYDVTVDTGTLGVPLSNFVDTTLELEFPFGDIESATTIASTVPFENETLLPDAVRWTIDGGDTFAPQSFTFRVIVFPEPGETAPFELTPGVTLEPALVEPHLEGRIPIATTGSLQRAAPVPGLGPALLPALALALAWAVRTKEKERQRHAGRA